MPSPLTMSRGMAIVLMIGQVAVLVGRLGLVIPAAFYHRGRAVMAFDRELRRLGVPAELRRALRLRYRDMVPLNPLRYRVLSAGPPHGRGAVGPSEGARNVDLRKGGDSRQGAGDQKSRTPQLTKSTRATAARASRTF